MTNERPENVWAATLPNGLRVRVLCKPDFQRSYAVFATCYGGADRRFRVNDTWTDTPAGVAHYLEHKLFDMPDGSDAERKRRRPERLHVHEHDGILFFLHGPV